MIDFISIISPYAITTLINNKVVGINESTNVYAFVANLASNGILFWLWVGTYTIVCLIKKNYDNFVLVTLSEQ